MIYLDNNASTKLDAQVAAAMAEAFAIYGNASSVHGEGRRARRAIEQARDEIGRLIGARCEEIFFTSGGTEANALAIFGSVTDRGGHVVTTAAEHPSVREAFGRLSRRQGCEVIEVAPEPDGVLDPDRFESSVRPGTSLVSVMAANNEFGAIFPVERLAACARDRGARFHTDAVQAAGRVAVDVSRWSVDLASFSAHKLHGPKGVGALFVRKGVVLSSHTPGGGQEKKLRAGTENTVGIVGFGAAARLARERLESEAREIERLRDRLEAKIVSQVPRCRVIGAGATRLPNTSAVLFEAVSAEALLVLLDLEGIAVSAGSACSSGTLAPSPAILCLQIPPSQAKGVVRFSLSRFTTEAEVDRVTERLPGLVAQARDGAIEEPLAALAEISRR